MESTGRKPPQEWLLQAGCDKAAACHLRNPKSD